MFELDILRDWDELTRLQGKLAVDLLRSKQAVRRKVRRKLQERGLGLDIGPRRETNLMLDDAFILRMSRAESLGTDLDR